VFLQVLPTCCKVVVGVRCSAAVLVAVKVKGHQASLQEAIVRPAAAAVMRRAVVMQTMMMEMK
jgi:hypothetical protein